MARHVLQALLRLRFAAIVIRDAAVLAPPRLQYSQTRAPCSCKGWRPRHGLSALSPVAIRGGRRDSESYRAIILYLRGEALEAPCFQTLTARFRTEIR